MKLVRDQRREKIVTMLREQPFLTDEDLADGLGVSVATIRLDRTALDIPEVRVRLRKAAAKNAPPTEQKAVYGKLLEYNSKRSALSMLTVTPHLVDATGFVPAQTLYGMATALGDKVLDLPSAVCGVGNIKYKAPVRVGDTLVWKLTVVRQRGSEHYVWAKCLRDCAEVFRAKFILKSYSEVRL